MLENPVVQSQVNAETSTTDPFQLTTHEASAMFVIGLCIFMALGSLVACTSLIVCQGVCGKADASTPRSSTPSSDVNNMQVHENVQPSPRDQRHDVVDAEEPGHAFSSFRGMSMPPMVPPMSLDTPEPFRHLTIQTSWGPDDMPTKAQFRSSNTVPVDSRHKPSKLVPSDARRRPSNAMPPAPPLDPADHAFFDQHGKQRLPDNPPPPLLNGAPLRMSAQLRALPSAQPNHTRQSITSIPTEFVDPNFDYGQ